MSESTFALRAVRSRCAVIAALCWSTAIVGPSHQPAIAGSMRPTGSTTTPSDVDSVYYAALKTLSPGSSDSATRQQAVAEIPLAEFSPDARTKARGVLSNVALFRRLPKVEFEVEASVYQYFLTHPEVAVSTWRAMEISQFELRPTAANVYHADARDGSVGTVEIWKSTAEETVIYCDGAFKSPLLVRPIIARSIMRLRTQFFQSPQGTPMATHTADVFVEFPSQTVETVARLISPVSSMIADRNFRQLTLYVHLMSLAMSRQPAWVQTIARRMDSSDEQREDFLKLAADVRANAERRAAQAMLNPLPVDDILAPLRQSPQSPVVPVSRSIEDGRALR